MRVLAGLLNVVMTTVFLVSVLVQYNDEDPMAWMAICGLAAAVCDAYATGRIKPWQAYSVALSAGVRAAVLTPSFWGMVSVPDLVANWEMKSEPVEHARERGGLLIVATWMIDLAVSHRTFHPRVTEESG